MHLKHKVKDSKVQISRKYGSSYTMKISIIKKLVRLRKRTITRDLKTTYNDKVPVHQNHKNTNLYEYNYRFSKYMKQKLTALCRKIGKFTIIFG